MCTYWKSLVRSPFFWDVALHQWVIGNRRFDIFSKCLNVYEDFFTDFHPLRGESTALVT